MCLLLINISILLLCIVTLFFSIIAAITTVLVPVAEQIFIAYDCFQQQDNNSTSHLSAKASCSINFETNNILLYPDNHTIQQTEQSISSAFISSIDDILALSSHNTDIFNLTNVSTTLGIIEKQYDATPVSLFDVHFSLSKSLPCDKTISKMDTAVISTSLWTSLPCVGASVNAQDFYQETKSILEGEVVTGNFGNVMIEKAFDSSSMNMIGESMMRSTMRCGSLDIKYISE